MTDKQTNLHPKNDSSINLKPNIVTGNIPDKAVTLDKLDQNIQDTISNHTSSIANNRANINKNTSDIASLTSKDVAENKNVLIRLECREDGLYVVGTDI